VLIVSCGARRHNRVGLHYIAIFKLAHCKHVTCSALEPQNCRNPDARDELGLALGVALSLLLIFVVNKQSFGWTIQFHIPAVLLGSALLLVWLVTIAAALYPARVATRMDPLRAIREE